MQEKPKIIKRGSITYYLYSDKVVADVGGGQFVNYNQYENWNRQGITLFRTTIEKSKPEEYGSPVEQMSLAYKCGIKSAGTQKPTGIK